MGLIRRSRETAVFLWLVPVFAALDKDKERFVRRRLAGFPEKEEFPARGFRQADLSRRSRRAEAEETSLKAFPAASRSLLAEKSVPPGQFFSRAIQCL